MLTTSMLSSVSLVPPHAPLAGDTDNNQVAMLLATSYYDYAHLFDLTYALAPPGARLPLDMHIMGGGRADKP